MSPTVKLVPYDTTWPLEFEAEADRITRALDGLPLRLEHIGSTSIADLSAKPVIHILAGRPGNVTGSSYVAAFKHLGYDHKARTAFRDGITFAADRRGHITCTCSARRVRCGRTTCSFATTCA